MVKKTKIKEKKVKGRKAEDKAKKDKEGGLEEEGESEEELEASLGDAEEDVKKLKNVLGDGEIEIEKASIKGSKPISALKKGDKIKVDGKEYEIDAHYVLMDHGKTKEMVIEIFDKKTDKDFQLRYFSDQIERSMEFYELQEILYVRKEVGKIEW